MPKKSFQLSIPSPCHEDWETMTPTEQGRHCAACDKIVIDFSTWTQAELVAYFNNRPMEVCGRFREDQLTLYPIPSESFRIGWRPLAAAFALFLSSITASLAQNQPWKAIEAPHALPTQRIDPSKASFPEIRQGFHIRGLITDQHSGDLLPGADIIIHSQQRKLQTNGEGYFETVLDQERVEAGQEIIIQKAGYASITLSLREEDVSRGWMEVSPQMEGVKIEAFRFESHRGMVAGALSVAIEVIDDRPHGEDLWLIKLFSGSRK